MLLQAALLINAALVVGRSDWVAVPASLAAVAVCGGFLGILLAKTSCPDVIAHLTAAIVGLWAIGFQVLTVFPELGASRRDRLAELIERSRIWYRGTTSGNQQDDTILFALVLAFTLWLVSYLAVWTLFRRRWVLVSILLPGFLVLVTLGYSPELGSMPLVVALLLSGGLSALYFAFRRDQVWRRFRIPSAPGISRRVSSVGTMLVVAVLILAWSLPQGSANDTIDNLRDRVQGPAESIGNWWIDVVPSIGDSSPPSSESYADFDNSFEMGGAPPPGNDVAATLTGVAGRPYLAGMRYGVYTGRGWESDVAETFDARDANGNEYSPQMTFQPQQDLALSTSVATLTEPVTGNVTLVRPRRELLFTIDAYLRADLPTSVQLSWRQLENELFDLRTEDVPSDLQPLASLLLSTKEFSSGRADSDGSPLPDDEPTANRIVNERQWLRERFVETRWTIDEAGAITLIVSGQIPQYDDVEAVFARSPMPEGSQYEITGLESNATDEDLRNAGSDYPVFVRDRYLSLPESVTQRTRDFAVSLAGELSNSFDIARAIEREVRTHIEYSRDVDSPPSGSDGVDYVLFESPIGDCDFYASAMAVLLRAVDIPSRVVVGFHPSTIEPTTNSIGYLESDAHVWVEVFFPGYGWIPFEPTQSEPLRDYGPDEGGEPDALDLPTSTPTPLPDVTPTPTEDAAQEISPSPTPIPPAINEVTRTGSGGGSWRDWIPWAVVTVLMGLSGLAWFAWTKPYRGLSPAGLLVFQVTRFGRWMGVQRDPAMTPDEYAAELGNVVPAAKAPLQHVTQMYTTERYGNQALSRTQHRDGARALRYVRRSIARALFRRQTPSNRSTTSER